MCELVFYTNCWKPNACKRTLLNKYSPSEIRLSRAWSGGMGWKEGVFFPLGQSDVKTHSSWNFFSFIFFDFAIRCPETQWPHPSLSSCLIWTNLSYPLQPKRRTRLHKSFIKYFWTINKCTRRRNCLLQTVQGSLWKWSKEQGLT